MAADYPLDDLLKNSVIVKKNKTRHKIDKLQTK